MKTHHILQTRIDTPLGPMLAARSERGLSGLWFDGQKHHPGELDAPSVESSADPLFDQLAVWLERYFSGGDLPEIPLDPQGTAFQQAVWRALLAIETGRSDSYGAVARNIGRSAAVRAVGAAVGRNPISIVIPCHRVLGATGELTGYAGGIERKKALLKLEQHEAA
ncbi:MAG TPA: methylated-DNA--[protein]-cysteine S-methyltransferase [Burkholderiaceae bacterium]|jgi:methylated-DNA-[protein]-cysteine S-methyltransferase